jgi:copper(I)-binding protein
MPNRCPTAPPRKQAITFAMLGALTVSCSTDPAITSSNRGVDSAPQATSIENAYIVPTFIPGSCALQDGALAQLRFTITNNRPAKDEQLLSVDTDAAEHIMVPQRARAAIPPGESLAAGQNPDSPNSVPAVTLTDLRPRVTPATAVPVTFAFEEFGRITLHVPIEACPVQK